MIKLIKYFLLFLFILSKGFAQDLDSLSKRLKTAGHDSIKLKILVQLSEACNEQEILKYALPAVEIADGLLQKTKERLPVLKLKANALNNVAYYYMNKGENEKALHHNFESLKIQKEINDKKGITVSLNNIGSIYESLGDIALAIKYWDEGLQIAEEMNDKSVIGILLTNIGTIYKNQGDIETALKYFIRSLRVREDVNDKLGIGYALNSIGTIYDLKKDTAKALDYYRKSLKIRESFDDKFGIGSTLNNIAVIYSDNRDLMGALHYYFMSLSNWRAIGNIEGMSYTQRNISDVYYKLAYKKDRQKDRQKNLGLARLYCDSALRFGRELGFPDNISGAEELLSAIDEANGNFKGAFEHYKQFILFHDSISSEKTRKLSLKNQLSYEYQKKEAIMKEKQEKERVITEEKSRFQQIVIIAVTFGLLLVIVFAIFIFRTLKITNFQKHIIEQKQKEILDSIHYAKKIQSAVMSNENYIGKTLKRLSS
jgi:tetratricopeptide (TPR) repeat protein